MKNFDKIGLPLSLLNRLKKIGFVTPTPIQAEAIPHVLKGSDILGSAQTGTGKTGAYGIPLVTHLLNTTEGNALVLLPTRELAKQVIDALRSFIDRKSKISTALLIGGESMHKQCKQLHSKPRLIVGTPGRIHDHLKRGTLNLKNTNFLVLDEGDRMLDMGFGVQLNAIARYLIKQRQTLLFSATLPKNILKLSAKYLTDPIRVSVGESHIPIAKVKQEHMKLSNTEKYPRLLKELKARRGSILVFVKTKYGADRMASKLRKLGHKSDALHGDLHQNRRNRVISDFRKQKYRILVATDVASRGLDIPHIEYVINYDLPQNPEDYIHRIGRTARAGAEGEAINFLSPDDRMKWKAILRFLNPGLQEEKREKPKGKNKSKGKHHYKPYKKRRSKSNYRSSELGG